MAGYLFNNAIEDMAKAYLGVASAPTGTIKAALMTTSYTYDETDVYFSDLSGEASGTGYTSGGQTIDNLSVTQDDTINGAYIDFDNETFSGITVSNVNAYVLYFSTGVPSTSKLIGYFQFTAGAQTINDGSIVVTPPATGVFKVTNA